MIIDKIFEILRNLLSRFFQRECCNISSAELIKVLRQEKLSGRDLTIN